MRFVYALRVVLHCTMIKNVRFVYVLRHNTK
jgi:hypothetical protein